MYPKNGPCSVKTLKGRYNKDEEMVEGGEENLFTENHGFSSHQMLRPWNPNAMTHKPELTTE